MPSTTSITRTPFSRRLGSVFDIARKEVLVDTQISGRKRYPYRRFANNPKSLLYLRPMWIRSTPSATILAGQ